MWSAWSNALRGEEVVMVGGGGGVGAWCGERRCATGDDAGEGEDDYESNEQGMERPRLGGRAGDQGNEQGIKARTTRGRKGNQGNERDD